MAVKEPRLGHSARVGPATPGLQLTGLAQKPRSVTLGEHCVAVANAIAGEVLTPLRG
jgi:hypothetical protein